MQSATLIVALFCSTNAARINNNGNSGGSSSPHAGPTSMHDLFIRSSLEAASTATFGTGSSNTNSPFLVVPPPPLVPPTSQSAGVASSGNFCHMPPVNLDEASRRLASHRILSALLLHPRLRPLMPRILGSLSDDGLTPFMLAVQCKSYRVANFLLDYLLVSSPKEILTKTATMPCRHPRIASDHRSGVSGKCSRAFLSAPRRWHWSLPA